MRRQRTKRAKVGAARGVRHLTAGSMIKTLRLLLCKWDYRHRKAFAGMHANPDVMGDLGGPINQSESYWKFERYRARHSANTASLAGRSRNQMGHSLDMRASCLGCQKII